MFNKLEDVKNSGYLFTEQEFNVLKEPKMYENNSRDDIRIPRNTIKNKILNVCLNVESELNDSDIDLHTHWSERNKVSLIYPCPRNYNKVDWVGVRFGRSESEIKKLNKSLNVDSNDENDYGFLKFQNIQVNVREYGMEIGLYHSIPQDTFDRGYVHDQLSNSNTQFKNKLIKAADSITGLGFVWFCNGVSFEIDEHEPKEFIDFYTRNDLFGCYSHCSVFIPKWSLNLYKDNIVDTVEFYIEKLLPLYETMSWRIN